MSVKIAFIKKTIQAKKDIFKKTYMLLNNDQKSSLDTSPYKFITFFFALALHLLQLAVVS